MLCRYASMEYFNANKEKEEEDQKKLENYCNKFSFIRVIEFCAKAEFL
jgi:hypothetical protein